jgi:hypothetical protein
MGSNQVKTREPKEPMRVFFLGKKWTHLIRSKLVHTETEAMQWKNSTETQLFSRKSSCAFLP